MVFQKGLANPNYGKHLPCETRKKMSESRKGKYTGKNNPMYGKTGKNSYWYGKHHSKEDKRKMSEAHKGKNNPMYGKHLSDEIKQKLSLSFSGKNNPRYGKSPSLKSSRGKCSICSKGHWVRSSWELQVADWLWNNGIDYSYEPRRFVFTDKYSYLPDFYIPDLDLYIEVKGWMNPRSKLLIRVFQSKGYKLLVLDNPKLFEEKLKEIVK